MLCFISRHLELEDKIEVLTKERDEYRMSLIQAEAEVRFLKASEGRLGEYVKVLGEEKRQLLDDLLIASGVKMSKMQEQLILRESTQEETTPDFTGQSSAWAHRMTSSILKETQADKNKQVLEMMQDLERQAGIKIPDNFKASS